jgi:hypothetical protein
VGTGNWKVIIIMKEKVQGGNAIARACGSEDENPE